MKTIEVPKVSKPCWMNGAYTIAFVRSNKGNFILKGYSGDVRYYLKHSNIKWFANFTYYSNEGRRSHWKCGNKNIYISTPTLKPKKKNSITFPYHFAIYKKLEEGNIILKLKRLPNRYIPEIFE